MLERKISVANEAIIQEFLWESENWLKIYEDNSIRLTPYRQTLSGWES